MNQEVQEPTFQPPIPSSNDQSPELSSQQEEKLFLTFVADRDVPCPRCGHNLRAATQMKCMECGDDLRLAVAGATIVLRAFLCVIAPGFFAGILAIILTFIIVAQPGAPWEAYGYLAMGYGSGVISIVICGLRKRFLCLPLENQFGWAALNWLIHIALFYFTVWINF